MNASSLHRCAVVTFLLVNGCSSSDTPATTGGDDAATVADATDTGSSPSGAENAVDATAAGEHIAFDGSALARSDSTPTLTIVVNDQPSTCSSHKTAVGRHYLRLAILRNGNKTPIGPGKYATGASDGTTIEAYLEETSTATCGSRHVGSYDGSGGPGAADTFITLDSVDATEVRGSYAFTMRARADGSSFTVAGTFSAPLCSASINPSCG